VDTGFRRNHTNLSLLLVLAIAPDINLNQVRRIEMKKLRILFFAVLGLLLAAIPALAQPANEAAAAAASSATGLKYIAAGIGFAIAVFGGAIGQSRVAAAACEGTARNPGASARIQIMMILGLALIESLVLFALVVVFAALR
jgi:F-type H+-transporting ATPase subunit c